MKFSKENINIFTKDSLVTYRSSIFSKDRSEVLTWYTSYNDLKMQELDDLFDKSIAHEAYVMQHFSKLRNKFISHRDLDMREHKDKLPDIVIDKVENIIKDIFKNINCMWQIIKNGSIRPDMSHYINTCRDARMVIESVLIQVCSSDT